MDIFGLTSSNIQTGLMRMIMKFWGTWMTKTRLHKTLQNDTSSVYQKATENNIYQTVQHRRRDMHDSWLGSTADEVQSVAHNKNTANIFGTLKTVLPHLSLRSHHTTIQIEVYLS